MAWEYEVNTLAEVIGAVPVEGAASFCGVSKDTRTLQPGEVYFALSGEQFDGERFVEDALAKGAAAAVCRGVYPGRAALTVKNPLLALQDFAAYHRRRFSMPLLALTGSCGKTSAKEMIAAVLETRYGKVVKTRGNLNNEIGCPLSLLQLDANTDMAVIEMGANHGGEIAALCRMAKPTESAVTMVTAAHLEGFGSVADVAAAKGEIVQGMEADGVFYVNGGDAWCRQMASDFSGEKVFFGEGGTVHLRSWRFDGAGDMVLDIAPIGTIRLPLWVPAQTTNVLLAVAVGLQHGVTAFEEPLRAACTASNRFRRVQVGPLMVFDDTYNANPASMKAALAALAACPGEGRRMAALGTMLELGETAAQLHREVGEEAGGYGIDHVFAFGPHGADFCAGALAAGVADARAFETHEEIAEAVVALAQPGDKVLLKGSRGMRMETVLGALEAQYSAVSAKQID